FQGWLGNLLQPADAICRSVMNRTTHWHLSLSRVNPDWIIRSFPRSDQPVPEQCPRPCHGFSIASPVPRQNTPASAYHSNVWRRPAGELARVIAGDPPFFPLGPDLLLPREAGRTGGCACPPPDLPCRRSVAAPA